MSEINNLGFVISETTAKDIEFNIVNQHRDFVIAEGIIQEAEQENRNKRCYAREFQYRKRYKWARNQKVFALAADEVNAKFQYRKRYKWARNCIHYA